MRLSEVGTTDATGTVTLHVRLPAGVGAGGTLPYHVYLSPTAARPPTQEYATVVERFESNGPLGPLTDPIAGYALSPGAPASDGTLRFVCGKVLDCHGSSYLAAEGLTADLPDDQYQGKFVQYWHSDGNGYLGETDRRGNFCVSVGDTTTTTDPSGFFKLEIRDFVAPDAGTGALRVSKQVGVPSEGDVMELLFPPSAADQ